MDSVTPVNRKKWPVVVAPGEWTWGKSSPRFLGGLIFFGDTLLRVGGAGARIELAMPAYSGRRTRLIVEAGRSRHLAILRMHKPEAIPCERSSPS